MGFDPISVGLMVGLGAYGAASANKDRPRREPMSQLPATPVEGGFQADAGSKARKYRPAAQLFKDEDLRLGVAGRLGG